MSGICSALTVCTPLSQLDVSLYRGCGAARAINTCQPCEWLCSHIIRANTSLTEAEDEDVRQENTHKQSLYGLVTVSGSCLLMSWIFLNSVEQTVQYVDSQIKEWETEHLNILKIIYHGPMLYIPLHQRVSPLFGTSCTLLYVVAPDIAGDINEARLGL